MRTISKQLLIFITLMWCFLQVKGQKLPLSTHSDSAHHYYRLGWKQIMDYGNYTQAEELYRKSVQFDPRFAVGLSMVGRITPHLEERKELLHRLHQGSHTLTADEKLVVDVSLHLIEFLNARDENDSIKMMKKLYLALETGLMNFGAIGKKYPDEIYFISEYFEVMNYLHGPEKTLDTLRLYNKSRNRPAPFLIGYQASLEAELGYYKEALELALRLQKCTKDKKAPKPYAVLGDIYLKQGDLKNAVKYINKALELDPRNTSLQKLKSKVWQRVHKNN